MVLKKVEADIPDIGYSRELYRGFLAKEIVVTLNSKGEVDITTYDSYNNIKDNETILEMCILGNVHAPSSQGRGEDKPERGRALGPNLGSELGES